MKAVADRWPPARLAVLAAKAGCDLLPVCKDHHGQVDAIEALVRAVESEEIRWKEMDAACDRILLVKERFLLPYRDPAPKEARAAAGVGERVALSREIAERGGVSV
jgi:beta-glucosidase-like glycosyl hydrolase